MRNTKRELDCFKRLQSLTPVQDELIAFLMQEYLLSADELKAMKGEADMAKHVYTKLATLSEERKIQLLEFEWSLLPTERIKLLLVTDRGMKEFTAEV